MRKRGLVFLVWSLFFLVVFLGFSSAAVNDNPQVSSLESTICCEKTQSGLFCQDVPAAECASNSRQVPTGCESTSFCKPGFCYDSDEGTCADNTPQLVCNAEGGIWNEESPPQCELGCCTLGDQAAFVTLVRCKKLSSFLGLNTNYNTGIRDEVQCVLSVANQDKGACVFDFEFERTCKFTTRADCGGGIGDGELGNQGEFFVNTLCSTEELGTNCGPTRDTICVDGKDEVYFVDSCGNPANIYDASKINDQNYWAEIKDSSESCNPGVDNAGSASCGNCNYLLGSFCRDSNSLGGGNPTYGDNICADLNCEDTSNGNDYRHGESWCVFNDAGSVGVSDNAVGSRFFKHICINGKEVVEACADFRQEECIEDSIEAAGQEFSQAACRVNRWQDCFSQDNEFDCVNEDRRDCNWKSGIFDVNVLNNSQEEGKQGVCVPKNTPGLKFWEGEEIKSICAQGNAACVVTFEKGLFGGEKCSDNCECLEDKWEKDHAELCSALGDCGPGINWIGAPGSRPGFEKFIERLKVGR